MRILELTGEPIGTGGQEMFIINLLRHIDLTDLQIDWLTPYYCENDTYRKEVEDKGGRVICFNLHFNPGGSRNNIVNPLNNFLKKNYYDVVHIHSGSTSVLALCAFVAKWNKVKKIIVHSHSTGLSKSLKHYVLRMITNPILSMCPTHYLACSVDAGVWKFPASVVRGKLQIINNGIDLNLFAPDETKRLEYRKMLDISDKTMVIGNVGRFSYVKNQEFLIEIVSQLKQRRKNIKLMLVGVGETMNEIKSLVVSKKLTEDVLFIGGVNNVYDYMQAMDIFAFPSRWEGLGMVGVIGVNYRIFKTLAKNGISVFMVSQASSENNTTFAVRNADADLAVKVLDEEFALERAQGDMSDTVAEKDLATVAIVGENMKRTPGIAGKLFGTLGSAGISVIACAQGASETNISFVIKLKYLRKALNSIHDSFFLSQYKVLNLFIAGVGTVGGNLLEQIRIQQPKLMQQNGLKLNVVGIANSKHAIFCREGLNLETCIDELKKNGQESSPEHLKEEILKMNIFNSVFVDCTANQAVSDLYEELLNNNVSVVAANKIAASSSYENYIKLKETARHRGIKFLFETNVGAGLPIINTMNDLINSGDHILKLEAVLSGTLNYIFNTLSADIPFSKAIMMAKEEGYSEPDPRIDLSGKDVIRKLVILAREAGYKVEQEDVKRNLFIPESYFEGSLDDFWRNIQGLDARFEEKRQQLEAEDKRFRFVAKMENGICEVGLQEVDAHHPFYELEGSNNIIMISTERYHEYPMIIKGYGAGADVTAAGVFADIISIANIR